MASPSPSERKIACNICRRRKTACDRSKPKCSLCVKGNFDCEYADTHRQPGLRAGYVHQLEERIDELESRLSTIESRVNTGSSNNTVVPLPAINELARPDYHVSPTGVHEDPTPPLSGHQNSSNGLQTKSSNNAATAVRFQPLDISIPSLDTDQAESTTDPLSYSVISELCKVWFQKYHRWFPILHQPTFSRVLEAQSNITSDQGLVIQAIVAVTLTNSQLLSADAAERRQWQEQLSTSVVIECIKTPSFQTVQALLILSILQYGEGRSMVSWNVLAIARRIATHLGLGIRRGVDGPTAMTPTALRRLPSFVNTTVAHEEEIRAFWMIATLESISTIGSRYEILGPQRTPGNPLLPCSDSFWNFPETVLREHQIRPYHYCSAFSLCVILAVNELSNVHRFLQRPFSPTNFEEMDVWQSEAQQIDERLTAWRDEFVAAVFRLINAEYAHRERPEMDAYVVLTNCVLNTAVITLLQQRASYPKDIEQLSEPWTFASNRCIYACENTAFKVRQMDEDELLICHPHLIFSIFVAARFYIVHSKALDANVPTNLHSLAFALHTCGKRWPLARMYEHIIRVAVAEYRTPIAMSRVPKDFYDLRKTTFDISESLIAWTEGPGADVSLAIDTTPDHNGTVTFTPMVVNALA